MVLKKELNKLFVYGTLKKGFNNHHYVKEYECLGEANTVEKYPMINSGYFPSLIDDKGIGYYIKGFVYLVDDNQLVKIDNLEGHPTFFQRKEIDIAIGDEIIKCWCYFRVDLKLYKNYQFIDNY